MSSSTSPTWLGWFTDVLAEDLLLSSTLDDGARRELVRLLAWMHAKPFVHPMHALRAAMSDDGVRPSLGLRSVLRDRIERFQRDARQIGQRFGEFNDDLVLHGVGFVCQPHVLSGRAPQLTFVGIFRDGVASGFGRHFHHIVSSSQADTMRVRHEGQYVDGKACGFGKFADATGRFTYHGNWFNGKRMGEGRYYQDGCLLFEGLFEANTITGRGRVYDTQNRLLYHGALVEGKYHGVGTQYDASSKIAYEGEFERGVRHGVGRTPSRAGVYVRGKYDARATLDRVRNGGEVVRRGTKRKPSEDEEEGYCVLCADETRVVNHAYALCGHLCVCQECALMHNAWSYKCPVCRRDQNRLMRIYRA